jgi:hypothetical protein
MIKVAGKTASCSAGVWPRQRALAATASPAPPSSHPGKALASQRSATLSARAAWHTTRGSATPSPTSEMPHIPTRTSCDDVVARLLIRADEIDVSNAALRRDGRVFRRCGRIERRGRGDKRLMREQGDGSCADALSSMVGLRCLRRLLHVAARPPYRNALVIVAVAITMASLFATPYSLVLGRATPRHIPVGLIGDPARRSELPDALKRATGGAVRLRPTRSLAAAQAAINEQRIHAALVLEPSEPRLLISSASGVSVARCSNNPLCESRSACRRRSPSSICGPYGGLPPARVRSGAGEPRGLMVRCYLAAQRLGGAAVPVGE